MSADRSDDVKSPGRLAGRLAGALARRPLAVLGVGLALSALALWPASRLRIETDLTALLPDGAPAADDYRTFLRTFGGFEKVFAIVESAPDAALDAALDEGALPEAARALADALQRSPEVRAARAGLEAADERFFLDEVAPRLPLLVAAPGWREDLAARLEPDAIRTRVETMRRALRGPSGALARELFPADPLGLAEGLLGAAPAGLAIDPLSGVFVSKDRDAALVLITPARAELDPAAGRGILAALDAARREVERQTGARLSVRAIGGPIYAANDEAMLKTDLQSTLSGSTFGVAAVLLAGFEGILIPVAITVSVFAGVLWTVAAGALGLGSVTVVGVGFAAALLGVGVEYGIHGGARFRLARMVGESRPAALATSFREAGPGIVSSALTSAVAVAALAIAHFRPLRELGLLLTVGVLATLATTVLIGAPLAVAIGRERRVRASSGRLLRGFWQPLMERTVGFAARRPRTVLAVAALLSIAALVGLRGLAVSVDPRALRPKGSPLEAVEALAFEKFGLGLDTSTVVVRRADLAAALDAAAEVRRTLAERLGERAAIDSPSDWIVLGARRAGRLAELRALPFERAAGDFERELRAAGFRVEPFAPALGVLRAIGRGEDPGGADPAAWPDWMAELVRVAPEPGPQRAAVAVHVRVPIGAAGEAEATALAAELSRRVPGAAFASAPRVGRELRDLASRDLVRSSAFAALLVAIVVLGSLRGRLGASLLASLPLLLGCLWTFGLWGALARPLDLVSVAALPVLFGTGIDLGVHAVHGARHSPGHAGGSLRAVLMDAGPAMVLVMLTASIGFGSLAASRVPGLRNAGLIVAVGGLSCLAATLLVLPALEAAIATRRSRRGPPPAGESA